MIYFNEETRTFYLESKDVSYVFRISGRGLLNHLYYGGRVPREDLSYTQCEVVRGQSCNLPDGTRGESLGVYANECPTYGRSDFRESMLSFDFDGVRVGDLKYDGHRIFDEKPPLCGMPSVKGKQTLAVWLKDELHKAEVVLYYTVYEDLPVLLRHTEIVNYGDKPFAIDRAYSFCVDMPDGNTEIITLPGAHLRERVPERHKLTHGTFVIDSKYGVSSAQMNPFAAIVRKNTDEESGEI